MCFMTYNIISLGSLSALIDVLCFVKYIYLTLKNLIEFYLLKKSNSVFKLSVFSFNL